MRNLPRFFTDPATFSSLPANQSYRPLVTTTLALDYRLGGGLKPVMFHVTSFALFLAQCIALLVLYRRLMDASRPHPMNRWLALFAATWYALHTAIAETVNYIIARSDIMSSLGTVLAVLTYASRGRARTWHLYLIPAAAAVLSKEQGVMVAPILFAYTALFERNLSLRDLLKPREFLATLRPTLPAFVLCTGILLMGMSLSTNYNPGGERWPYLITQPYALLHYALMFVAPVDLTADTDWQPFTTVFDGRVFVGLLFIVAAIGTAFLTSLRKISRPIAFGILWFFLALVPSSSVIPLSEVVNDHRMVLCVPRGSDPQRVVGDRARGAADWQRTTGERDAHGRRLDRVGRARGRHLATQHHLAHRRVVVARRHRAKPEERPRLDDLRRHPDAARQPRQS